MVGLNQEPILFLYFDFLRYLVCVSVIGLIIPNINGQSKKSMPYSSFIPVIGRIKTEIAWLKPEVSGYPKALSQMFFTMGSEPEK